VEDYFQQASQAAFVGSLNRLWYKEKEGRELRWGRGNGGEKKALNEARCKKLGLLYVHLSYFMKETGWN
jgi:hypothetical protein